MIQAGSQQVLAEMYAIGLLASFCINMGCLLIYRYLHGTAEICAYYTIYWVKAGISKSPCLLIIDIYKIPIVVSLTVVAILIAGRSLPRSSGHGRRRKKIQAAETQIMLE